MRSGMRTLAFVLVAACQHQDEASPPVTTEPVELSLTAQPAPSTEPVRASAHSAEPPVVASPPDAVGEVGIASCDEYIRIYRDCYKAPEVAAAVKLALDAMVRAWKEAASQGPTARSALETGCRQAIDAFPRHACQ